FCRLPDQTRVTKRLNLRKSEGGEKAMRIFSIIGSLVVLACVLVVSYAHTYALMVSVGFHGVFGHFAVVAFEALFLVSVTNIVFAKTRGVPPGAPLYAGFFLGLSVVFWGNVRAGLDYGLTGAIIGGLVPVTLVVGESILAFALIVSRRAGDQASRADQADGQTGQADQAGNQADQAEKQAGNQADQAEKQAGNQAGQADQAGNQAGQAKRQAGQAGKQATRRAPGVPTIEEQKARRVALQLLDETGQLPGRYKLANQAGVRESVARRVLEDLRAKQAAGN